MNDYAYFLHHLAHGAGIWVARIGLLVAFVLHIFATISLTRQNKAAREKNYAHDTTMTASRSSRIMIVSGLIILAFVVFHILHFTVRIDPELANLKDPEQPDRFDAYGMVIKGFSVPWVALFYVVAISLLCSHLSHGIASIFQTLGLRSAKTKQATTRLSWLITIALWAGFLAIPLSVLSGIVKDEKQAGSAPSDQAGEIADRAVPGSPSPVISSAE